jgi:hypothetical protein
LITPTTGVVISQGAKIGIGMQMCECAEVINVQICGYTDVQMFGEDANCYLTDDDRSILSTF